MNRQLPGVGQRGRGRIEGSGVPYEECNFLNILKLNCMHERCKLCVIDLKEMSFKSITNFLLNSGYFLMELLYFLAMKAYPSYITCTQEKNL